MSKNVSTGERAEAKKHAHQQPSQGLEYFRHLTCRGGFYQHTHTLALVTFLKMCFELIHCFVTQLIKIIYKYQTISC